MGSSGRRDLVRGAAALAATIGAAPAHAADPWPSRPLRILTPFGAGGAMDMVARLVAPIVGQALGQPVVVENRPGATGTLCMGEVAQAAPDGHTMMITGSSFAIVGLLMPNLRFRMSDFAPLTRLTEGPSVLVVPAPLGVRSFAEFVAEATARPGQWSYGSVGVGSSLHLGGEELKMLTGTDLVHVPYRGWPHAATDLLANRIQVYFSTIPDALPMIQSGQLRALAVTHSARIPALAEVPTVTELGFPKLRVSSDFGMAIGAGVPAPIRARLEAVFRAAIREPAIQERLLAGGTFVVGSSAEEYAALLAEDIARYAEIIRVAGIRLE